MRLLLATLLVFLTPTSSLARTLTFAPETATCVGGTANDAHLYPSIITCTKQQSTHWNCFSTPLHDALFRIHHTTISCTPECVLEYHLDFTPLAVFIIVFCTTLLAGVFLALAMYLAVLKMVGRRACDSAEGERLGTRPGYGSFGGRLYRLGNFSDSVKSLLEFDANGELSDGERDKDGSVPPDDALDWVTERIYLG